ncbi:hypothetical protein AC578_332 [Pseudocercospora eumusae]|uniref:Mediator of RNA polymerase II transcription subunit 6 n=1 Tax=Pseudocercospora eumusae TaxID=321146 RepID=A0A139HTU7_9PEZI|nr:hypothetical protein AC578_332 [Pseudocercospora eumusae]
MATKAPPPDEMVHARPEIVDWWVNEMNGQPMDENMIHRYMSESPFFDWSSKNGMYLSQAQNDWNMYELSNKRKGFEDLIRSRHGLEFMIVAEPQPVADKDLAAQGVKTGIYVVRKQDRQRLQDNAPRPAGVIIEGQWEITILATYYIVGMNVYQAPNVFDIVGNRLLAAASSLNKLVESVHDLPRYDPALGYSYLPQSQTAKTTTSGSVAGSPARSREGSLGPGTDSQSLRSGSVQPASQITTSANSSNYEETRLLADSLRMAILYGDDFTDENPLVGEPGSFKFSSSHATVKKRRADEEAALAKARAEKDSASTSRATSPKVESAGADAFKTKIKEPEKEAKSIKDERRASKGGEKVKRRKSKGGSLVSPTTPGSATAVQTPAASF